MVWKFLGFTEGNTIRAGHNCAILVDGNTGNLQYFDFGRYDVPDGYGRARCDQSDPQLLLKANAILVDGQITNLKAIMEEFYHDDSIHHSAGPMFYKVLSNVNKADALDFVRGTQARGFVDYDIFRKGALNCSRYIGHLVKSVLPKNRLTTYLKHICPSPTPMDTVINADVKTPLSKYDGEVFSEQPFSAWLGIKYYLKSRGAFHNDTTKVEMPDAHWIGSKAIGSYYTLVALLGQEKTFRIKKFSAKGVQVWVREFQSDQVGIDLSEDYSLQLGSRPEELVVEQDGKEYRLVSDMYKLSSPQIDTD